MFNFLSFHFLISAASTDSHQTTTMSNKPKSDDMSTTISYERKLNDNDMDVDDIKGHSEEDEIAGKC